MKNVIIVHGQPGKEEYYSEKYPTASNFLWIPVLSKQFVIKDIKADVPEMPHAYLPVYDVWKKEFERFDITPETSLIGHSTGGGFLVRWLSEHPEVKVDKVVLVAPWLDPGGELCTGFFDFEIDPDFVARTNKTLIFVSDDDSSDIQSSVTRLKSVVKNIQCREFSQRGHFIEEKMMKEGFPELLDEIVQ